MKRERHINIDEIARVVEAPAYASGLTVANHQVVRRWCYVVAQVPLEDQLLAQKLMIEADESEFRRVALQHRPTPEQAALAAPYRNRAEEMMQWNR